MGIITALVGLPALIKEIKDLRGRVEELEAEVKSLREVDRANFMIHTQDIAGRIRKLQ